MIIIVLDNKNNMLVTEPIIGMMASMPVIAIRSVLSNWVAYREKGKIT